MTRPDALPAPGSVVRLRGLHGTYRVLGPAPGYGPDYLWVESVEYGDGCPFPVGAGVVEREGGVAAAPK